METQVEYIPKEIEETIVEYEPVERTWERVQYLPVETQIVHYPEHEKYVAGQGGRYIQAGYAEEGSRVGGAVAYGSGSGVGGTYTTYGPTTTYTTGGYTTGGYTTGGYTTGGNYTTGGYTTQSNTYTTGGVSASGYGNEYNSGYANGGSTVGGNSYRVQETTYVTSGSGVNKASY